MVRIAGFQRVVQAIVPAGALCVTEEGVDRGNGVRLVAPEGQDILGSGVADRLGCLGLTVQRVERDHRTAHVDELQQRASGG